MLDVLQWSGFVLVVAGYWTFARSKFWGAVVSLIGGLPLGVWAFVVDAHGVLALQIACVLMNLRTAYQERPCDKNQSTSPAP